MSKRLVTAVCLVWGAALVANCGGSSDAGTSNPGGGSGGDAGEAPSAGKTSTAGDGVTAGTSAGGKASGGTANGGSASGGVPAEAGQSTGGEPTAGGAAGAAGMSVGGESSAAGADAGGAGGEASVPVSVCPATIDLYPGVFAKAVCEKRVDCCTSDLDTCMKEETDALATILPDLLKSKQDGIAAANCGAFDKCIAAIKAGKCEDWPAELGEQYGIPVNEPACRQWITPKLLPLDACSADYQCTKGYCNANTKKCVAFVADGATCGAAGQLCNLTTSYCEATSKKCVARLANGAKCTAKGQCASRICDTGGTDTCIAPSPKQCEYVPASCAFVGIPRDSVGWSLVAGALALGAALRRRRAAR